MILPNFFYKTEYIIQLGTKAVLLHQLTSPNDKNLYLVNMYFGNKENLVD